MIMYKSCIGIEKVYNECNFIIMKIELNYRIYDFSLFFYKKLSKKGRLGKLLHFQMKKVTFS